jgi:Chaperone of endosialidase
LTRPWAAPRSGRPSTKASPSTTAFSPIPGVFDGADRWLEIIVNGTTLTPRQQLRATPHAAVASLFQVPLAMDTASPSIMHLISHSNSPQVRAVLVETYSTEIGAQAITGIHNEDDNEGVGVAGVSYSGNGFGVTGSNQSPSGNNTGVYGNSISPQGTGVYGLAPAATGNTFSDDVGIGTTNPAAKLHVVRAAGDSTDPLRITTTTSSPLPISTSMTVTGSTINTTGTLGTPALSLNGTAAGNVILAAGGGNVGIGDTTPGFQLQLSENSAAKPTSGSWTISSDARLKRDIQSIDGALDRLLDLQGVTYRWIDPASQGGMTGTYTGMIAQDVEPVFPEWVGTDARGYKTLTVIGFEGLTVEALRELRAEQDAAIDDLHSQLSLLQARNQSLQSQLDALRHQLESLTAIVGTGAAR